jgi:hypothetical protein
MMHWKKFGNRFKSKLLNLMIKLIKVMRNLIKKDKLFVGFKVLK